VIERSRTPAAVLIVLLAASELPRAATASFPQAGESES
jgi:hypothetical protein